MESNKQDYYKLSKKEIESINELDLSFPKIENFYFKYGDEGFRYKEKKLDKLFYRAGIMASILSMSKNGLPIGIMISGGNNNPDDNGIEISSEKGKNISLEEEKYFEEMINADNLKENINLVFSQLKPVQGKCIIVIGIDNHPSSQKFSDILIKGLKFIDNCSFNLYSIIPCPSLFFLTMINQMAFQKIGLKYKMIFSPKENYWIYLNQSFDKFHSYYNMVFKNKSKEINNNYENELVIDCSNGIGSLYKDKISNIFLNKENNFPLKLNFINDNDKDINIKCRINSFLENKASQNNQNNLSKNKNVCLSSDLDNLIYYMNINNGKEIKIIKGEKMIILFCKMLNFLIDNFSKNLKMKYYQLIKMGIITSFYTNKSFITYYEQNLKTNYELCYTSLGLKNFQNISKNFDISICYQYNGSGSIFINEELSAKFGKLSSLIETSKDSQIIELFQLFIAMFNPTTSDGVANLLVIESILKIFDLSIKDIYNFYEEIPYRMDNIEVKDINKFLVGEDGNIIEPKDVKNKVNELCKNYENSRIIIRPSVSKELLELYIESNCNEKIYEEIINHFKIKDY